MAAPKPNNRFNAEIAKLPTFDEDVSKVASFVTVYKLYIRMMIRKVLVEE